MCRPSSSIQALIVLVNMQFAHFSSTIRSCLFFIHYTFLYNMVRLAGSRLFARPKCFPSAPFQDMSFTLYSDMSNIHFLKSRTHFSLSSLIWSVFEICIQTFSVWTLTESIFFLFQPVCVGSFIWLLSDSGQTRTHLRESELFIWPWEVLVE